MKKENDMIKKLEQRKYYLQMKKAKIDTELKDVNAKIRNYRNRLNKKELEETVILLETNNIKIYDIKKIIKENPDNIKKILEEERG